MIRKECEQRQPGTCAMRCYMIEWVRDPAEGRDVAHDVDQPDLAIGPTVSIGMSIKGSFYWARPIDTSQRSDIKVIVMDRALTPK